MQERPLTWALFETAPWDHHLRLPGHHLARWLSARGHTVAYLSAPVSPWHFLSRGSRALARKRWNADGPVGQWRSPRLFTYIPRTWLPVHRQWPFDSNASWNGSEYFSHPRAGEVMRSSGFDRVDVLIMQNFQMPQIVRHLQPRLFVVRIEDDLAGFPKMPRIIVDRFGEVVADADMVTVTAHELDGLAKLKHAREVYYLPNGVNFPAFERPAKLPARPADLPPGRVAIYAGTIDTWFNLELVTAAARKLTDWSFVFIGPVSANVDELRSLPNVRFLGAKPQEEIPPYLWHSQAGIIPFRRNRLIESVAPLKLFEYLAAGLPVVTTRWNEMERLASPATMVDSVEEFVQALQRESNAPRDVLSQWARRYNWDSIFSDFEAAVRVRLARRDVV